MADPLQHACAAQERHHACTCTERHCILLEAHSIFGVRVVGGNPCPFQALISDSKLAVCSLQIKCSALDGAPSATLLQRLHKGRCHGGYRVHSVNSALVGDGCSIIDLALRVVVYGTHFAGLHHCESPGNPATIIRDLFQAPQPTLLLFF